MTKTWSSAAVAAGVMAVALVGCSNREKTGYNASTSRDDSSAQNLQSGANGNLNGAGSNQTSNGSGNSQDLQGNPGNPGVGGTAGGTAGDPSIDRGNGGDYQSKQRSGDNTADGGSTSAHTGSSGAGSAGGAGSR